MEHPERPEEISGRDRGRALRSGLLAGGAALAMTLAGLGIAGAQIDGSTSDTTAAAQPADEPTTSPGMRHGQGKGARLSAAAEAIGIPEPDLLTALRSGQSIAQVAESEGVAVQKVVDALVADAKAHLAEHVAAGDLTQAEADARATELTTRITEMVNRTGLPHHGPGPGPGPGRGHGHPGADLSVAATAIGISEPDLLTALRSGQSIAQVAGAEGVAVQKVVDALLADAKAHLAEHVAAGRTTQAEADAKAAGLAARITEMVNRTGFGPGRGHHHMAPSGAPAGTTTS